MYLNISSQKSVRKQDVIGIFDLDNASHEPATKEFLKRAEKDKHVAMCGTDLPKAFVLCEENGAERVYLTTLSSASVAGRNKR